jgi:outer membrane lipoprotein carrier protein
MNRFTLKAIFLIAGLFAAAFSAYALDVNLHLKKELEKLNSFTASFTQRVIDIDKTEIDPSSGTISFVRPGKFIWSYHEPYEQDIISDGQTIWVFDKDLEQVTVRPAAGQATRTPLQILDDPASVDQHYRIELLTEREDVVEIQLTPLAADTGFRYVILIFDARGLAGMEIYDSFDHYNSLTFTDINLDARLDNDLFSFVTPEGVDVIHASE